MSQVRIYFMLFLLLVSASVRSQGKLDSLIKSLQRKQHDTSRCRTLTIIAATAPDGIWQLYNTRLLSVSKGLIRNSPEGLKQEYVKFYVYALKNSASSDRVSRNFDESIRKYKEVLSIASEMKMNSAMLLAHDGLAEVYREMRDFKNGILHMEEAMKLVEKIGKEEEKIQVYANYASFLLYQGDFDKAEKYFDQSIEIGKKTGQELIVLIVLSQKAKVYQERKEYAKSRKYYFEILDKLIAANGNSRDIGQMYSNIGATYFGENDLENAKKYLELSLEKIHESGDKFSEALMLFNSSSFYERIGEYEKCKHNLVLGLEMASRMKDNQLTEAIARSLYRNYKRSGDHQKAYDMLKLHLGIKDSINKMDYKTAIYESDLKYEFEKKAAIDSVQAEVEKRSYMVKLSAESKNRNLLMVLSATIIFISVFVLVRIRVIKRQDLLINEQRREIEAQKDKLENKQKELIDSLNYARRIHMSFMPSEYTVKRDLARAGKSNK